MNENSGEETTNAIAVFASNLKKRDLLSHYFFTLTDGKAHLLLYINPNLVSGRSIDELRKQNLLEAMGTFEMLRYSLGATEDVSFSQETVPYEVVQIVRSRFPAYIHVHAHNARGKQLLKELAAHFAENNMTRVPNDKTFFNEIAIKHGTSFSDRAFRRTFGNTFRK